MNFHDFDFITFLLIWLFEIRPVFKVGSGLHILVFANL
jgi:hypothetical protein